MIGDSKREVLVGRNAGCRTMLLCGDGAESSENDDFGQGETARGLLEAVNAVLSCNKKTMGYVDMNYDLSLYEDSLSFLVYSLFGDTMNNPIMAVINRAYIDMAPHILTGFGKDEYKKKWKCRNEASREIKDSLNNLGDKETRV